MKITVVLTSWAVPFAQVVNGIFTFEGDNAVQEVTSFINAESLKWWEASEGNRCMAEYPDTEPYAPIEELGYDTAQYELWGGEHGFNAMLDAESAAALHEAHYQREYDAKGETRPGYLINAYVGGGKPGGITEDKAATYQRQQAQGMAEVEATYGKPVRH